MKTLLLDTVQWDLVLDVSGNIALASNPYALAQSAANAIRLFAAELWFDTTQGVPYYSGILGETPPVELLKAQLAAAALASDPEIVGSKVFISGFDGRTVSGQAQVTDRNGSVAVASF